MKLLGKGFLPFVVFMLAVFLQNPPLAGGLDFTLEGVRSIGMGGALRSNAYSTSALLLNPAGISMAKLYHIEATYMFEHPYDMHVVGGQVVDSITSMLGVGLGYFYRRVEKKDCKMQVHDARLGLALPIYNIAAVGVNLKYLRSKNSMKIEPDGQAPFGRQLNSFSLDAGAQVRILKHFGFGVVGYNLTKIDTPVAPFSLGLGGNVHFRNILVGFDTLFDWSTYGHFTVKYMAGGEVFLYNHVPLRIGYSYDDGNKTHTLSGGVGYISSVASIEMALRGDLNEGRDEMSQVNFIISIKYFLN